MRENLKETDVWGIDQPPPSGQQHRTRDMWSAPTSSATRDHVSQNQKYLIKKAIGIAGNGTPIDEACTRVWGKDAVTPGLVQTVRRAMETEK